MKHLLYFAVIFAALSAYGQTPKKAPPQTLKGVLLEQLRTTHNEKDWFVPVNTALEGVTAEQAMWKDKSGNHSVGQIAYHLLFWNTRALGEFKGEKQDKFSGNNEETFDKFDAKTWRETVKKLNIVMSDWEKAVEGADEKKLKESASTIAHIGTHNAYHTGQIVYVRRLQGSWDAEKGVK